MRKPTRKTRRFFRRKLRIKGKGKGKRLSGKGVSAFTTNLSDDEYEDMYFGRGKGKGRGKMRGIRSSGKGAGRKRNPRGKDGRTMKCFGRKPNGDQCQSETHLKRNCPFETGTGSKGSGKALGCTKQTPPLRMWTTMSISS